MARNWTRDELIIALGLYCKLEFGKLHGRNTLIRQVAVLLGRTPGSLAMKLVNLASLDPAITRTGRSGLAGASALDREMWQAFASDTAHWMPVIEERLNQLLVSEQAPEKPEGVDDQPADYSGGHYLATTKQRKGQNLFRDAVFSAYQSRCCITGVAEPRLLVASHIKPWSQDVANRLNPANGLCLSALVDRAFDKGLVTLSDDYRLLVSPVLRPHNDNPHIHETFYAREGQPIHLPEKFDPDPALVAWHRENIYLAG